MGSQLLLRWDNHLPSFASSMKECLDDGELTDVTISCQGRVLHCHKLVLSVASPHFKNLLKANPGQHPIIIMRDIPYADISALLTFIYQGEVTVSEEDLPSFLKTAKALEVRGLADDIKESRRNSTSHLEPEVVVKEEPCEEDDVMSTSHGSRPPMVTLHHSSPILRDAFSSTGVEVSPASGNPKSSSEPRSSVSILLVPPGGTAADRPAGSRSGHGPDGEDDWMPTAEQLRQLERSPLPPDSEPAEQPRPGTEPPSSSSESEAQDNDQDGDYVPAGERRRTSSGRGRGRGRGRGVQLEQPPVVPAEPDPAGQLQAARDGMLRRLLTASAAQSVSHLPPLTAMDPETVTTHYGVPYVRLFSCPPPDPTRPGPYCPFCPELTLPAQLSEHYRFKHKHLPQNECRGCGTVIVPGVSRPLNHTACIFALLCRPVVAAEELQQFCREFRQKTISRTNRALLTRHLPALNGFVGLSLHGVPLLDCELCGEGVYKSEMVAHLRQEHGQRRCRLCLGLVPDAEWEGHRCKAWSGPTTASAAAAVYTPRGRGRRGRPPRSPRLPRDLGVPTDPEPWGLRIPADPAFRDPGLSAEPGFPDLRIPVDLESRGMGGSADPEPGFEVTPESPADPQPEESGQLSVYEGDGAESSSPLTVHIKEEVVDADGDSGPFQETSRSRPGDRLEIAGSWTETQAPPPAPGSRDPGDPEAGSGPALPLASPSLTMTPVVPGGSGSGGLPGLLPRPAGLSLAEATNSHSVLESMLNKFRQHLT